LQEKPNKKRVVAIGLDAADLDLLERWIEAGHLPNIARLFHDSARFQVNGSELAPAETTWTMFLTGCHAETTGFWSMTRYSTDYKVHLVGAYDFDACGPFYDYCKDRKVIVLDMPQARKSSAVDGIQVLGWGAHSPQAPPASVPEGLLEELTAKYGTHPAFNDDTIPVGEIADRGQWLEESLITGIETRTRACVDFMESKPWDLVLVVYGEPHSAGHCFWHLSQPDHPLYEIYHKGSHDPLLAVYEAVDKAVGEIASHAPDDASIVLYSPHGMATNPADISGHIVLPELMFRHNFGGKAGLAKGDPAAPLEPLGPRKEEWMRAVWALREFSNPIRAFVHRHTRLRVSWYFDKLFGSEFGPPHPLDCEKTLWSHPPMWYRPLWSQMKAFALPTFSNGQVRLNVRGREANGIVEPADYDRTCDEISELIRDLKDARTGKPIVADIVRTRKNALDDGEAYADGDLVVLWNPTPADVVDSSKYGRIGPAPFFRSGGHVPRGFFAASGDGIMPGKRQPIDLVDLAPTILDMLDVPSPNHFDGQSGLTAPHAEAPA
jgi:predicted AlkP superfamily phosphohydrolase/phosphomutase